MATFIIECVACDLWNFSWKGIFLLFKKENITLPYNAQHGLNLTRSAGSCMWYIGPTEPWQRITALGGEGNRMCWQIFFLYFFPTMFLLATMKGSVFRGHGSKCSTSDANYVEANELWLLHWHWNKWKEWICTYSSLSIVDVFIGHHLLSPSPYSLSWWVRRGVQGEGAGKNLIGWLIWPTQVKWNDCYCTLHNSWECRFLRSQ